MSRSQSGIDYAKGSTEGRSHEASPLLDRFREIDIDEPVESEDIDYDATLRRMAENFKHEHKALGDKADRMKTDEDEVALFEHYRETCENAGDIIKEADRKKKPLKLGTLARLDENLNKSEYFEGSPMLDSVLGYALKERMMRLQHAKEQQAAFDMEAKRQAEAEGVDVSKDAKTYLPRVAPQRSVNSEGLSYE